MYMTLILALVLFSFKEMPPLLVLSMACPAHQYHPTLYGTDQSNTVHTVSALGHANLSFLGTFLALPHCSLPTTE